MARADKAPIRVVRGDITKQAVDAIVNAANSQLAPGGGVSGAIHRAAGPELWRACQPLAPCPTGEARITPGFALPARFVIHTVGPVWRGGLEGEETALRRAYQNSLSLAAEYGLQSIAFPAISTGIYGYPLEEAAHVAIAAIRDWFAEHGTDTSVRAVRIVAFDERTARAFEEVLAS